MQAEHRDAARLVDEGNALEDAGRIEEAMQCYLGAIRRMPSLARAHLNYGNALLASGDVQAAIAAYAAALAHDPNSAAAHYNLGNALLRAARPDAALAAYDEAIRLQPDFVDAHVALGSAQDELRRPHEAIASYRRALAIRPDYVEVYYNLGNALRGIGRLDEAEASFRRALDIRPDLAEAHHNLGILLQERGRQPEAVAAYRRALACRNDFGAAAAHAYHCANHLCDWSSRKEDEARLAAMVARDVTGISPFVLLSMVSPGGTDAARLQRRAGLQFAQDSCGGYLVHDALVDPASHPVRDRLRIGYLSADFHEHATMHLLRGVLAGHDRSKFSIHGYSYGSEVDGMTEQARQSCAVFRTLATLSDRDAAAAIAADGIDILVDLKGFTQGTRTRISAQRPAPVLVSWLGYPGTLGHPRLADYIIGDAVVTPPDDAGHFSETLALMPHCYQPNDRQRPIAAMPRRTDAGLPERGFVFCSLNQGYKLTPETFDVWCRLLVEVPGSVLWLLEPSPPALASLKREAQARGVADERLVFAPKKRPAEHLGRLGLADLALDTFRCTSHTTGSDTLWAGVPLVTRTGDTFASRVAASLLHAVGLPELVTRDWAQYFALAKSLALAPERLAAVRAKLAVQRLTAPLFDTERFTRDLERLYERIWRKHARGAKDMIRLEA
jgi:predicted O-linked N-acetylglucosamine transferase (SPINDLY family)